MHELSVTARLLDLALDELRERGLERIHSITVTLGAMHGYDGEWIRHYFDDLAKGTPAEDAELLVVTAPIAFRCRDCGTKFEFDAHGDDCSCPGCHGFSYDLISGKQLMIEQMEAS